MSLREEALFDYYQDKSENPIIESNDTRLYKLEKLVNQLQEKIEKLEQKCKKL